MQKSYRKMTDDEFKEVYESRWHDYLCTLEQYKSAVEKGEMKYIGKQLDNDIRHYGDDVALVCMEMRRRFGECL